MKKLLPLLIFLILSVGFLSFIRQPAFADSPTPPDVTVTPPENTWVTDSEVTFAGKNASRSGSLLNWTLENYKWAYSDTDLVGFWAKIRNVVYALIVLLVLGAAFTMIISGGQSISALQFVRKFIIVLALVTFSYAIVKFLYQITDAIQSFFIYNPDGQIISTKDLLNISFQYDNFLGYRRYGYAFDESAFISLLLTKITAITYFIMAGILLVRKIILWFFIAVSPIFPLLTFWYPIRNTAKIWIGEFFRWLLYAPLFVIFLSGLVSLWRSDINLLPFDFSQAGKEVIYPTAINILLGGPGQTLTLYNSINYTDTFAQYIVALIMLWIVILLPFVLLRIFLDYLSAISLNTPAVTGYFNKAMSYFTKEPVKSPGPAGPTPPPPPASFQPTGVAMPLPFSAGATQEISSAASSATSRVSESTRFATATPVRSQTTTEISRLVNFPIPTMRDVARYETSRLSTDQRSHEEIARVHETLEKIANPASLTSTAERSQFMMIKEKLTQAQTKGDAVATSILAAANALSPVAQQTSTIINQMNVHQNALNQVLQKISNPYFLTNTTERQRYTTMKETLVKEKTAGDLLAPILLAAAENAQVTSTLHESTQKTLKETLEKIAKPTLITSPADRAKYVAMKEKLEKAKTSGNLLASSLLTVIADAQQTKTPTGLPVVNQVQAVNLDDYEAVKKMWEENYRKLDVPKSLEKPNRTRKEWVQEDMEKTTHAITLLTSSDVQKMQEGMKVVSNILPFLLIGGFSLAEVLTYLKAKLEAMKTVLAELDKKEEEEETTLAVTRRHTTDTKHMTEETAQETHTPAAQNTPEQPTAFQKEKGGK